MPYSGPEFTNTLTGIVKSLKPATCLDVGVGAGKTAGIVKGAHPACVMTGIEAHGPYAKQFAQQWATYNKVHIGDALDLSVKTLSRSRFDLVVCGDVIEHMWLYEAKSVLRFWADRSKFVVVVWPNGYPQDDVDGVISEVHRSEISLRDLASLNVVRFHRHHRGGTQFKNFAVIRGRLPDATQAGVSY